MIADRYDRCWNADSGRSWGYVLEDNSVCPNKGMVTNPHTSEYLGASPDGHVSS
jgi:hypothetical protein